MPNKTKNLALFSWLRSDKIKVSEINENFNILDDCVHCVESGTVTTNYVADSVTKTCTWRYKKYSDGTSEAYTDVRVSNMPCTTAFGNLFKSGKLTVNLPTGVMDKSIDHQQFSVRSIIAQWAGRTIDTVGTMNFEFYCPKSIDVNYGRTLFITLKGRWK